MSVVVGRLAVSARRASAAGLLAAVLVGTSAAAAAAAPAGLAAPAPAPAAAKPAPAQDQAQGQHAAQHQAPAQQKPAAHRPGRQPAAHVPAAAPAKPYGTVTARTGLNVRQFPSTDASIIGTLRYHAQIGLVCKVHAQNIAGNSLWYLQRGRHEAWVPAKYVANTGTVAYCKDVFRNKAHAKPDVADKTARN